MGGLRDSIIVMWPSSPECEVAVETARAVLNVELLPPDDPSRWRPLPGSLAVVDHCPGRRTTTMRLPSGAQSMAR